MCGRYSNHVKEMHNWSSVLGNWPAGHGMSDNVAPSQFAPVVVMYQGEIITLPMRWGLVPAWSKTPKPKYATFNARIETIAQKPAFRDSFSKRQTCLVPSNGYYEWTGEKGNKQPYFIERKDKQPLMMAGIWEFWQQQDQQLYSFTILTKAANDTLAELHPRMPVLLKKEEALTWQTQYMNLDAVVGPEMQYWPKVS
ncbi:MAG: putative SOS response-associated peptidase YedK [Saprospiraceae bacterium]|jgi:putative SOS response-associated peptidase YedK